MLLLLPADLQNLVLLMMLLVFLLMLLVVLLMLLVILLLLLLMGHLSDSLLGCSHSSHSSKIEMEDDTTSSGNGVC